ncbi:hypothetical protein [Arthrobacter sp. SX1312]|uniref:hypothetical protein n=1 Tax=Arthrobacter sp. SX1312 TaxID=2058896 RepID=UPI000CE461E8|nr:hypothetical protein [Arthrobacter sp. SX1312]
MTESSSAGHPDGGTRGGHPSDGHPDGRPAPDRREQILEPSPGSRDHHAASIRDEQGIHEAGAVPAAYDGDDSTDATDGADRPRHPEDAAFEHDTWDGGAAGR